MLPRALRQLARRASRGAGEDCVIGRKRRWRSRWRVVFFVITSLCGGGRYREPRAHASALLVIDMQNDPVAIAYRAAETVAVIAGLRERARAAGVPVVTRTPFAREDPGLMLVLPTGTPFTDVRPTGRPILGALMITLTPMERDLHRALSARARGTDSAKPRAACLTYKELGLLVDPEGAHSGMSRPPFRTMFPALGHVSMYEVEHGRPMLSALVVAQDSRVPGPGFVELARHLRLQVDDPETFWDDELGEVVRFWSAHDPVLLLDAAVDRLMEELGSIKAAVRRLSGGS